MAECYHLGLTIHIHSDCSNICFPEEVTLLISDNASIMYLAWIGNKLGRMPSDAQNRRDSSGAWAFEGERIEWSRRGGGCRRYAKEISRKCGTIRIIGDCWGDFAGNDGVERKRKP